MRNKSYAVVSVRNENNPNTPNIQVHCRNVKIANAREAANLRIAMEMARSNVVAIKDLQESRDNKKRYSADSRHQK